MTVGARKHVIGITGNIATGKSSVVEILQKFGADTLDADAIVHDMMGQDSPLAQVLRERFGPAVVNSDGSINRPELGKLVFSDTAELTALEELIHPHVVQRMLAAIEDPGAPVLVLDAIKLIEAGIAQECDSIWVVDADRETQIRRIMQRNDVDRTEAERRIDAQPPQTEKLQRADVIINNSGSLSDLETNVEIAWKSTLGES